MGAFLGAWLGNHYREKIRQEEAEDYKNKAVIDAYLKNDRTNPVAQGAAMDAWNNLGKKVPKPIQQAVSQRLSQPQGAPPPPPGSPTLASQGSPPNGQTMDRSPVPASGPPAPPIPPPQAAGAPGDSDQTANPISASVAPAAPIAPPIAVPVSAPAGVIPAPPVTSPADISAPATGMPGNFPQMMTPVQVYQQRTAPLVNAQVQDTINRYESTTGHSFRDLSPEWQQFVLTGKEFRPSPIALAQYEEQLINKRIADLKVNGDWDKMSPRQRAEIRTGAKNVTPELRPQNFPGMISGKDVPEANDALGNPIDKTGMYRMRINPDGSREYVPEVSTTHDIFVPDDQSSTKVSKIVVDRQGNTVNTIKDVLPPPGYTPRETTQNGIRMVTQPDGSIVAVPVTTRSVSQPIIPGTAAPMQGATPRSNGAAPARSAGAGATGTSTGPPGRVVGGRPLPETTKERMDAQLGAYNNTLQLMNRVQANLPVLNSLISAGKIQLATTPEGLAQVVSRASNLTDQEAQMAADMQSLAEHINTIRGPLGATGFRGHEAFGALQAQRGQVLGNPKVTAAILKNTTDSLIRQKQAIERSFQQHGINVPQNDVPSAIPPPPSSGGAVQPIRLKDGRTLMPKDAAAAEAFKRNHPELIAQ